MKAAAIALSYGRREVCDLLGMWERQTRAVPLLLWLDGVPQSVPTVDLPPSVYPYRCPRLGEPNRIGGVRAAAVAVARDRFKLAPSDAIIIIDDDDFYSSRHVERTLDALLSAEWTGAGRIGIQWTRGAVPDLVGNVFGPGQHAAWAMRLRLYDLAGGYQEQDEAEDVRLADRIGWARCLTHQHVTHVRRQYGYGSLSSPPIAYDRALLRERVPLAEAIAPSWSAELDELEHWCTTHEPPG